MKNTIIYRKKQNDHPLFAALLVVLFALIFVRYVYQIPFPWEILLAVVALIALVGDRDEIIAMSLCCIPLSTSLQYIYAVAICVIIYAIKYWKDIRINSLIFPVVAMLAWEWLHCFDAYSSTMGAVRALIPLVFCAFLTFCAHREINYGFIARTLGACMSFMCVVVLTKLLMDSNFNLARVFSNMQRLGIYADESDVVGANFNPNFLGFLCVIVASSLIQLQMAGQGKKSDIAFVVFLLMCGMLTLSKTYLFCLALMIFLFALVNGLNLKKVLKVGGAMVGIAAAVIALLVMLFPSVFEEWIGRIRATDLTSGRWDLMIYYHNKIIKNPDIALFGTGVQFIQEQLTARFGIVADRPHNAIQELVICWGIAGVLLFGLFVLGLIASAKEHNPKIKYINYIPLILLLVKIQAGQLITTPANLLIFGLTYLSMRYCFENDRDL